MLDRRSGPDLSAFLKMPRVCLVAVVLAFRKHHDRHLPLTPGILGDISSTSSYLLDITSQD